MMAQKSPPNERNESALQTISEEEGIDSKVVASLRESMQEADSRHKSMRMEFEEKLRLLKR